MADTRLQGAAHEDVTPRDVVATDPTTRAKSLVVLATPGRLFSTAVQVKSGGADLFLWIFNAAAVGTHPLLPPIDAPAGKCVAQTWPGLKFGTGIVLALSTDDET